MKVHLECTYCGKQWQENVYSETSLLDKRCSTCNDKNVKKKRLDDVKIDYYQGCPPFEKKNDNGWPYDYGSHD